ncbi:MAG: CpaF/VirB11 family protein [Chloroflexales bacterium]
MTTDLHTPSAWPSWLPRSRMRPGMPPEPLAPGCASAAPNESVLPPLTIDAVLRLLWERGGWDGTLAPEESWNRLVGAQCPYPEEGAFRHVATYGPLDRLILDEEITDVHLNGPGREVIVRRAGSDGEWRTGEIWHEAWFCWLVNQLQLRGTGSTTGLQSSGTVAVTRPGRRPCTIRYELVQPLLCPQGPVLALRFLRPARWSLGRLVEQQVLAPAMATFLAGCVEAGVSILIIGAPGSGKTTLARALLNLDTIADTRLICIEDVPELTLPNPHVVQLVAREHVSMLSLAYTALRMAPTRLVLGEVRGAEAYALLAAMRAGNPILTTMHGVSARHGLDTFIGMALEAPEARGSLDLVRMNLNAQSLILVALERQGGQRAVAELAEVLPTGSASHPIAQARWRRSAFGEGWTLIVPPSDDLVMHLRSHANPLTLAEWDLAMGGDFR